MRDYLIVHESGTKDYYLYLSNKNEKKMSNYKFNEDEIVKLYNAIKKTLELVEICKQNVTFFRFLRRAMSKAMKMLSTSLVIGLERKLVVAGLKMLKLNTLLRISARR